MLKALKPFPRFSKNDLVDVRTPGAQLGDWEQGTVTEIRNYRSGPVYTITTPSGDVIKAEENDLRHADA
jgi:hypothetical protein